MNIKKLQSDLICYFKNSGLSTSVSIAEAVGMQQSTVYRSLYQSRTKLTRGLVELCNYAKIDMSDYESRDPSLNKDLMHALKIVWNGTDVHAKQLSRLLLTAHSCTLNSNRM